MNSLMAKKKPTNPPEPEKPKDEKPPRPRIAFDTDPVIRQAIRKRIGKLEDRFAREVSQHEVINDILRGRQPPLVEEIREVESGG